MNKIEAIIFDLGKVVFDLSFDRVFQFWAIKTGKRLEEIKNKFTFDTISDKFEKGEISKEQFRTLIKQKLDMRISDYDFDFGWNDIYLNTYSGVDELLVSLKSKYRDL